MSRCFKTGRRLSAALLLLAFVSDTTPAVEPRVLTNLWFFHQGPLESPAETMEPGDGWAEVTLPHDWAISGPFLPEGSGNTGKLPWWGEGWYRREFLVEDVEPESRVYFDFDGVMAFPKVYVNGRLAGQWDYGYMSFRVDATDLIEPGKSNVLAVHCDTRQHGSRWYPGAGIYRKVTMTVCRPVHVAHWGVCARVGPITDEAAEVAIETTIENHLPADRRATVEVRLIDPAGNPLPTASETLTVAAGATARTASRLTVASPELWDIGRGRLYTAEVRVLCGDEVFDEASCRFGIRTARFTADDGFHLNGRRVQLFGVNLHHDHGPLGAAFYPAAMRRQLEIMRDMGANAIRTSHNPPAPELLDLCDRMGLVVWNEAFDKWNSTADLLDQEQFEPFMERQIRNFVLRDRNHPCVVTWSIGNEIGNQPWDKEGRSPERVALLRQMVLGHDPTRPVSIGDHITNTVKTPILDSLDLTGWNYNRKYAPARERYPDKPLVYSESASALSARGFYALPLPENKTDYDEEARLVSSYDYNAAAWSDVPDREFRLMETDRYVAGEFVWTGFDYLGEPTPYNDQWIEKTGRPKTDAARSSYFGIVDLVGLPKDRFYLYRSCWRPEETTIHILPHWNWPDRVEKPVPVFVYTNGDEAELFLNGRSLGRRTKADPAELGAKPYYDLLDAYRLRWIDVAYEPGELKAVAYKRGRPLGEAVVRTAGPPAALRLSVDRSRLHPNGLDLAYVTVEMTDGQGNLCPLATDRVDYSVEGPAELAAVGNGDPLGMDPFTDSSHPLFFGKAVAILRSRIGRTGTATLIARSGDLPAAAVTIECAE